MEWVQNADHAIRAQHQDGEEGDGEGDSEEVADDVAVGASEVVVEDGVNQWDQEGESNSFVSQG